MSFSAYPKYKNSGVEWLGDIPAHWDVCAIKRLAYLQSGESIVADQIGDSGDYPVYGGNGLRGFTSSYTHDGYFALIGRQGALCGNVNYASGQFWASEHAVVVSPAASVDTRWLGELLRTMNLNQYSTSAAQPGLSVEQISRLEAARPPYLEQVAIAKFLDSETAGIDELVTEQQRLVRLLREKRQAVISRAVAKGLNPGAAMKSSGIGWLGDVPAHWEVAPLKRLIHSIEQGWSPQCEGFPADGEEEWGVLKVGCVNGGKFNPMENKKLPADLEPTPELGLLAGDLLISRANTRELVGSAAVVPSDFQKLLLCDKLYRLRVKSAECDAYFVASYLAGDAPRGQIELAATGASASMVNISQATILELPVPVPPIMEQADIMAAIDCEARKVDALVAEAERAIVLLQERRAVVISAAVTGKIDVRHVADAEAA